mmetsp:Transcript_67937/g.162220  ORF Transcript_67937/g.162220 Transcript_67937/m.162220 type:complete len:222 (-) Transcript_67937:123-788(-)
MPYALAKWAVAWPMSPYPRMPIVVPRSSPTGYRSHSFLALLETQRGRSLAKYPAASSAYSASECENTPLAFVTGMPEAAAERSAGQTRCSMPAERACTHARLGMRDARAVKRSPKETPGVCETIRMFASARISSFPSKSARLAPIATTLAAAGRSSRREREGSSLPVPSTTMRASEGALPGILPPRRMERCAGVGSSELCEVERSCWARACAAVKAGKVCP